jgi:hypothetical protein
MKYLKTYKIFESITEKEIDDVALDIRDILLPLKHDGVNFKVEPFFITSAKNIFIDVKIKSMDIKKYIDELRQLVSTLDEEGWSLNNRNLSNSFVVLTGDYDITYMIDSVYFNNIDEMTEIVENRNIELINFRFYKI